jgi:dolichol-phosphate mannosyltransferase
MHKQRYKRSETSMVGYETLSEREEPQVLVSECPQLSIIVPTFQEVSNLPLLVSDIATALAAEIPAWELIIVDDNSQDGSVEVCQQLRAEGLPITIVVRTHECGLSSAVVAGFAHARAAVLLVMDADLSHPAEAIPRLYQAVVAGADFAIGSRYVPGGSTDDQWSTYRWLNSKVASLLAMPLVSLRDPTAGFFAFPQSLLRRCGRLNPVGYKIALEILIKSRAQHIQEIPIHFRTRRFGKSKLKLKQQLLYLCHLYSLYRFTLFQSAPHTQHAEEVLTAPSSSLQSREKIL